MTNTARDVTFICSMLGGFKVSTLLDSRIRTSLLVNLHFMGLTACVPEAFEFTSRETWQTFVQLQKCTVFTTAGIKSCEIQM